MNEAELKEVLERDNREYRSLLARHQELDQRLEELRRKGFRSGQEEIEVVKLKKLKLQVKDRMALLVQTERRRA